MTDAVPPRPTAAKQPRKVRRWGLVGPLFRWELVRLARRGQDARARFILAGALLLVLTLFTLLWFLPSDPWQLFFGTNTQLTLKESATFGASFAVTFLLTQMAVMMLLTPAYAAGGISEEKERKTFPYLLVSDLTSWEIVTGKVLGRLTFLLGVMAAGLPILALTQFYGGVSMGYVTAAYFLTATTITMHAAIAAASAAACEHYRGALFRSYSFLACHALIVYPFSPLFIVANLYWIESSPTAFYLIAGIYGGIELILAAITFYFAVRWVSKLRAKTLNRAERAALRRRMEYDLEDREEEEYQRWKRRRRRQRAAEREAQREAERLAAREPVPSPDLIILDDPGTEANRLPIARAIPMPAKPMPSPASRRDRQAERDRELERDENDDFPRRRQAPEGVSRRRPRVDPDNPFLWKEKHILGSKRTADDDSLRGVLIALGIGMATLMGFFVMIAITVVVASNGEIGRVRFAEHVFILCGTMSFFLYLLTVGSAASVTVVRERQRQTLESLLMIPVDRRVILNPKLRVSLQRGWWWGLPASFMLPAGFLFSETPASAIPVSSLLLTGILLIATYAIWLSIRCSTATRAILWLLPAISALGLIPLCVWSWTDADTQGWSFGLFSGLMMMVGLAAILFRLFAFRAFEREGRD